MRTSSVRLGPVRCGVSELNTTAPPAAHRRRHRRRALLEALPAERVDVVVGEGAVAVAAGRHLRAAVLLGGVGEREPHREVLLRLDVRVAVVLVPRHPARLLGLLVDGLVPVQAHVGTDQVGAQAEHRRVGAERLGRLRAGDGVDGDREGAGLGDREAAVLAGLEEGVDLGLEPVEVVAHRGERVGVDRGPGTTTKPCSSNCATCSGVSVVKGPRVVLPVEASRSRGAPASPARYRTGLRTTFRP